MKKVSFRDDDVIIDIDQDAPPASRVKQVMFYPRRVEVVGSFKSFNYMTIMERLLQIFLVLLGNFDEVRSQKFSNFRLSLFHFYTFVTVAFGARSVLLLLFPAPYMQWLLGDVFCVFGKGGRVLHLFTVVCAFITTVLRLAALHSQRQGMLNSMSDLRGFKERYNYAKVGLSYVSYLAMSKTLKNFVILFMICHVFVYVSVTVVGVLGVHQQSLLELEPKELGPRALNATVNYKFSSREIAYMVLINVSQNLYYFVVSGCCFSCLFTWALSAERIICLCTEDTNMIDVLNSGVLKLTYEEATTVISHINYIIYTTALYNQHFSKWVGFLLITVFPFLEGLGFYLVLNVHHESMLLNVAQYVFSSIISAVCFYSTTLCGEVHSSTEGLILPLIKLKTKVKKQFPKLKDEFTILIASLSLPPKPAFSCLSWRTLTSELFLYVSFHSALLWILINTNYVVTYFIERRGGGRILHLVHERLGQGALRNRVKTHLLVDKISFRTVVTSDCGVDCVINGTIILGDRKLNVYMFAVFDY